MFLVALREWKGLSVAGLGVPPPFVLGFGGCRGKVVLEHKLETTQKFLLAGVSARVSAVLCQSLALGSPPPRAQNNER